MNCELCQQPLPTPEPGKRPRLCPACRDRQAQRANKARLTDRKLGVDEVTTQLLSVATHEEIAADLHMSKQAVQQIERRVLKRLRRDRGLQTAMAEHFRRSSPGGFGITLEEQALIAELTKYFAEWEHLAAELEADGDAECATLAGEVRHEAEVLRRIYEEKK